jgi:hypothetical protein
MRDKVRNALDKSGGKAKQVGGRAAGRPDTERPRDIRNFA